jgi:beta-glucosidase
MKKTYKLMLSGAALIVVLMSAMYVQSSEESVSKDASHNIELWPKLQSPMTNTFMVEAKIDNLLKRMTLQDKVAQMMQVEIQNVTPEDVRKYRLGSVLNGGGSMPNRVENATPDVWVKFLDALYIASMDTKGGRQAIPIFWGTDAVHGHNNLTGATIFPHNIGLGATHNTQLIYQIGAATAKEVRATGIEWVFSPTLAVGQNDRWGRLYESYSEDPALVARFATAMVEGLQGSPSSPNFLNESRVIATAKHFIADGGTRDGDDQGNSVLDEKELVAIHAPGYEAALNAGVQTVMVSFSEWNGKKIHGDHYLLTKVLKERMGFDGLVVSDWNGHGQVPGCTNASCAQAINAGIDMVMVISDWKEMIENTIAQVQSGEISQARIDDAVRRILRVKIRANLWDKKPSLRMHSSDQSIVGSKEHRAIARQAVAESLVLLKNNNNLLPIKPTQKILVAGDGADHIGKQAGGWSVWWQGVQAANENYRFPGATSIYQGLADTVKVAGGSIELAPDGNFTHKPDVAIVVFGENPYAESAGDLDSVEFEPVRKQSLALLKKLKAKGIPVVSVFISGRPLWVNPELNASDAFVAAWLPGTEGGGIADVLLSKADGSINQDMKGRLSFSWPKLPLQDLLNPHHDNYDPLFKLGYGLTYTDKLVMGKLPEKVAGVAPNKPQDLNLYVRRPLQPWHVFIENYERQQILSGAYAALPKRDVIVQTLDKDVQEDALRFTFKDTWRAALTIESGTQLNLDPYMKSGYLSLEMNVEELAEGGLGFRMACSKTACDRKVAFTPQARALEGKGWQKVIVPLSCFAYQDDDFSATTIPFALEVGGKGSVQIANVQLLLKAPKGVAPFACAAREKLSTTPDMLNEYWSIAWWKDRFEQKLADKKALLAAGKNIDVLFVGDSITQGWEKEGANVWARDIAPLNAFNIGFSGDRTENVIWRLQQGAVEGLTPKVTVLMIGTNNTGHRQERPKDTLAGIKQILFELKKRLPTTKILVLAVFPRDAAITGDLRKINDELNSLLPSLADNKRIFVKNINAAFLDKTGHLDEKIMPDLLHPNETGYDIWAKNLVPEIKQLME